MSGSTRLALQDAWTETACLVGATSASPTRLQKYPWCFILFLVDYHALRMGIFPFQVICALESSYIYFVLVTCLLCQILLPRQRASVCPWSNPAFYPGSYFSPSPADFHARIQCSLDSFTSYKQATVNVHGESRLERVAASSCFLQPPPPSHHFRHLNQCYFTPGLKHTIYQWSTWKNNIVGYEKWSTRK